MSSQKAVLTVTRPRAGKMRKIIRDAATAETLIGGLLVEFNVCHTPAKGMGGGKCDNAGRCAMGELLFRVGYSDSELQEMDGSGDWGGDVYRKLWDAYRIDHKDVDRLIEGNDDIVSPTEGEFLERQASVEKVIKKIDKKRGRVDPYKTRIGEGGVILGPAPTAAEKKVMEKFNVYNDFLDQEDEYEY